MIDGVNLLVRHNGEKMRSFAECNGRTKLYTVLGEPNGAITE